MPGLPDASVSLAHTEGAVVAGVGWHPVGVDIETVRSRVDVGTQAAVLTETELRRVLAAPDPDRAFLRSWTLKECLVKIGAATLDTASEVELGLRSGGEQATAERPAVTRYGALHLVDWFDGDLDAVVAAAGAEPPEVAPFPLHQPAAAE